MNGIKTLVKINKVGLIWIFIWIAIFILDLIIGLKSMFCCKGIKIIGTEYYRLFTGLLVHINIFHIFANVVAMYFVCEFIDKKINNYILFVFSILMGAIANGLFSIMNPQSYMVGGSPMIFALIGLIVILQWKRKDLPRFRLGTWYGNWIVGYAILGNIPYFSKDCSTLLIHILGFVTGILFGLLIIKKKAVE